MRRENKGATASMTFVVPSRPFLRFTAETAEALVGHHLPIRLIDGTRRSCRVKEAELTLDGHIVVTVEYDGKVPPYFEADTDGGAWAFA